MKKSLVLLSVILLVAFMIMGCAENNNADNAANMNVENTTEEATNNNTEDVDAVEETEEEIAERPELKIVTLKLVVS